MKFKLFRFLAWLKGPPKEKFTVTNSSDGHRAITPVWERTVCSNKLIDCGKRGYHLPRIKDED